MEAVAAHNPNLGDGESESSSTGDLGDGGVLRQRHQARHEGHLLHHGVREMLLHMRPVLVVLSQLAVEVLKRKTDRQTEK